MKTGVATQYTKNAPDHEHVHAIIHNFLLTMLFCLLYMRCSTCISDMSPRCHGCRHPAVTRPQIETGKRKLARYHKRSLGYRSPFALLDTGTVRSATSVSLQAAEQILRAHALLVHKPIHIPVCTVYVRFHSPLYISLGQQLNELSRVAPTLGLQINTLCYLFNPIINLIKNENGSKLINGIHYNVVHGRVAHTGEWRSSRHGLIDQL